MRAATLEACLLALVLPLVAAPCWAQRFEVAPLLGAGYTTSASIDAHAVGIDGIEIKGGFTWGGQAGYFFSKHFGAEVSWSQQETALRISTPDGSADLFDMKVGQLHGNLVYQWGSEHARLHPFALAGLGATFLSAPDLRSETRLSWAIGGGVKLRLSRTVGVRLQAIYKTTRLDDEGSAPFCDPFGFCQGALHQAEVLAGLMLRF
jgi:opacity protein-like surface antigen